MSGLVLAAILSGKEALAQYEIEVKFRGTVTADEQWGWTCYHSYYCDVEIQEILENPNGTLVLNEIVTVCYADSLSLKVGDYVECFGIDCRNCSYCPKQYIYKIACKTDPYYVVPEFSSILILLPFTAVMLLLRYKRKFLANA